jgi:AAA+ superfamily predicted ATPase
VGLMTGMLFPSIIGAATTLILGSYDIIHKHLSRDPILDIKPVFSEEVQGKLDDFAAETKTAVEDGLHKQNALFYGPPGTGKTMVSKWIAEHSNMNYICVSGGDLLKSMQGTDDVTAFENLVAHAKSLTSPTIIFIDEAEVFCAERQKGKVTKASTLFTAFLSSTSKPDTKVQYIFATNRLNDMDPALRDRCPYKIEIGLPGSEQRKGIITSTVGMLFEPEQRKSIFTDEMVSHIATETPNFSGRSIFYLLNRLRSRAGKGQTITKEHVDRVIRDFARQQSQIDQQQKTKTQS